MMENGFISTKPLAFITYCIFIKTSNFMAVYLSNNQFASYIFTIIVYKRFMIHEMVTHRGTLCIS